MDEWISIGNLIIMGIRHVVQRLFGNDNIGNKKSKIVCTDPN